MKAKGWSVDTSSSTQSSSSGRGSSSYCSLGGAAFGSFWKEGCRMLAGHSPLENRARVMLNWFQSELPCPQLSTTTRAYALEPTFNHQSCCMTTASPSTHRLLLLLLQLLPVVVPPALATLALAALVFAFALALGHAPPVPWLGQGCFERVFAAFPASKKRVSSRLYKGAWLLRGCCNHLQGAWAVFVRGLHEIFIMMLHSGLCLKPSCSQ